MGVDDADQAAPHPAWLPWGERDRGSGVGAALPWESGVLPCLPSIICVSRKSHFLEAKAAKSKAGSVPTWLQAQPQTPHGMLQAQPHASHAPTCTNTPPNPALYQPPRSWPQPQAFICFSSGTPGSKAPAATQGTHRAPGASSALPVGLAFCSPSGSGRGCAWTFSRTPGKWEFNHGQQMQEG